MRLRVMLARVLKNWRICEDYDVEIRRLAQNAYAFPLRHPVTSRRIADAELLKKWKSDGETSKTPDKRRRMEGAPYTQNRGKSCGIHIQDEIPTAYRMSMDVAVLYYASGRYEVAQFYSVIEYRKCL